MKPLSISRNLLIRDAYSTKNLFSILIGTRPFLSVLQALPPDTIENDDELHHQTLDPNKFDPPKLDLVQRSNALCILTPCHFTKALVSCRQKLSSRNQELNRAPGSWNFGIGSRSEIFINGHPCILFRSHSNQSTKHPVDRRLHFQIQEHFTSHVGGGASGDCQSSADIPYNVVGSGLVNPWQAWC